MFLANDELYYISKHKDGSTRRKAKVVVGSKEQAKVVFRQLHLEKPSPHQGVNRSLQQISKKYFWPKMTYDIMKWVKAKKNMQYAYTYVPHLFEYNVQNFIPKTPTQS